MPANELAEALGTIKMLNMVVLGAMLARRQVLSLEQIEQALLDHLPESKAHLTEANLKVLRRGYALGLAVAA